MAGYAVRQLTCPKAVTHPTTNRAQCRATALIETKPLISPLTPVWYLIVFSEHVVFKSASSSISQKVCFSSVTIRSSSVSIRIYILTLLYCDVVCFLYLCDSRISYHLLLHVLNEKSAQTLRAGCSKAEPIISAPPQTPFPGAQNGKNLFSWRWSLPSPTNPVW